MRSWLVVVKTCSRFPAQPPLRDVLAEQLARAFGDSCALGGVVLLDVQHYIETDHVHQAERSLRCAEYALEDRIDILGSCHAFGDNGERLALDRRPNAVKDE